MQSLNFFFVASLLYVCGLVCLPVTDEEIGGIEVCLGEFVVQFWWFNLWGKLGYFGSHELGNWGLFLCLNLVVCGFIFVGGSLRRGFAVVLLVLFLSGIRALVRAGFAVVSLIFSL